MTTEINQLAPKAVKRSRGRPRKERVDLSGIIGPNAPISRPTTNPPIGAVGVAHSPTTPAQGFFVEMLDIEASAGPGTYTDDYTASQKVFISNYEYYRNLSTEDPSRLRVLKIRGDSMEPILHDGQTCIVRLENTFTSSGIYVFSYGDTIYIKRLQRTAETIIAISENPKYQPFLIDSTEPFTIHGKLVLGLDYTRL